MGNIFTAEDAKKIRDSRETTLGQVIDKVRGAAAKGKSGVRIENLALSAESKKELEARGFTVGVDTVTF